MNKIDTYNLKGEKQGTLDLPVHIFSADVNKQLLAQAIYVYRANNRQYTSHTKKRSEVSGGGRKPWRQKGTGRARQGSTRAPHWQGGGVVFGPRAGKPRALKLTKKMRRAAILSAFSLKANSKDIIAFNDLDVSAINTSDLAKTFKKIPVEKTACVLMPEQNSNLALSLRNIPSVHSLFIDNLNVYDLLRYKTLILTKSFLKAIEQRYAPLSPEKSRPKSSKAVKAKS